MGTKRQDARAARIADEVRMYVDEELTIREIAAKVGASPSTVSLDLTRAKVVVRGAWGRHWAKADEEAADGQDVDAVVSTGLPEELRAVADGRTATVCRLLREERTPRMTQAEAARRLGVLAPALSRLELGRRNSYQLPVLVAYAEILGLKLSDILARAEELVSSTDPTESEPKEQNHGH